MTCHRHLSLFSRRSQTGRNACRTFQTPLASACEYRLLSSRRMDSCSAGRPKRPALLSCIRNGAVAPGSFDGISSQGSRHVH